MGKSTLTRALEQQRVGSAGPTQAKATETSAASRPETQTTAGPAVLDHAGVAELADAPRDSAPPVDARPASGANAGSNPAPSTFPTRDGFAAIFLKLRMSLQDAYYDAIRDACAEFGIDTPLRVAGFLAQVGHETGGLQYLEELGGTSYFLRYEGRRDLGNTTQGDGIKYHGRGLVQLTGKANYVEFGRRLGLDLAGDPAQAGKMPAAARIGAAFWSMRGLNAFADMNSEDGFQRMTKRLNGGLLGYADRHARWKAIRKIMGIDPKGK